MAPHSTPRFGLARALSKLGYCSRSQGWELILAGRVQLNGRVCRQPEAAVDLARDRIEVDRQSIARERRVYLMLNKPRGLVTTRSDEQARPTIYTCLPSNSMPWLAPVGRLDKASEGLLLLTNDTAWAQAILDPKTHLQKRYHVQVDCLADPALCRRLVDGMTAAEGEHLAAGHASVLRQGTRNSWLEIVLDEGKNRQIRRLLEVCGIQVLRLIRVAIGSLQLGPLPKGQFRYLTAEEVKALKRTAYRPC
jgi:23S rRNA pseudouridine2605 synthase